MMRSPSRRAGPHRLHLPGPRLVASRRPGQAPEWAIRGAIALSATAAMSFFAPSFSGERSETREPIPFHLRKLMRQRCGLPWSSGRARGRASPAMTQCVLRGQAQHPSLRRSLLHPPGPPFRRPGRAQRDPGPIGLSAMSLPGRDAIRPRRSRPGRRSVCCDAAPKINLRATTTFCVMPAQAGIQSVPARSRKWPAGADPRGLAVLSSHRHEGRRGQP